MPRVRNWENLSPAYKRRLAGAGISRQKYEQYVNLEIARGHRTEKELREAKRTQYLRLARVNLVIGDPPLTMAQIEKTRRKTGIMATIQALLKREHAHRIWVKNPLKAVDLMRPYVGRPGFPWAWRCYH